MNFSRSSSLHLQIRSSSRAKRSKYVTGYRHNTHYIRYTPFISFFGGKNAVALFDGFYFIARRGLWVKKLLFAFGVHIQFGGGRKREREPLLNQRQKKCLSIRQIDPAWAKRQYDWNQINKMLIVIRSGLNLSHLAYVA